MPVRARLLLLSALVATACGGTPQAPQRSASPAAGTATPAAQSPRPSALATTSPGAAAVTHVMVVVLENAAFDAVVGDRATAPYVNSLADRYGLATQYYATTHPSLPNYLELIAGTTFGIASDCTECSVEGTTVVDQLSGAGQGWTAYMEAIPGPCFEGAQGPGEHPYARKHNPFVYVGHLRAGACHVVPLSRLAADLAAGTAPPFLWISPDLCDDGHDPSCGLGAADRWLAATLPGVLASSWYAAGGVVLVLWDEGAGGGGCCGGAAGGHVPAVVVSARVRPGARLDTPLDHAGALRTVETLFGLPLLGDARDRAGGDLLPLLRG